jgi:hypothetical protein
MWWCLPRANLENTRGVVLVPQVLILYTTQTRVSACRRTPTTKQKGDRTQCSKAHSAQSPRVFNLQSLGPVAFTLAVVVVAVALIVVAASSMTVAVSIAVLVISVVFGAMASLLAVTSVAAIVIVLFL